MQIRTTNQLKSYMSARSLSPEQFARELKISNMTIRRLMRRHGNVRIPEKYFSTLDAHTTALGNVFTVIDGTAPGNFETLFKRLRRDGRKRMGLAELQEAVAGKLRKHPLGTRFRALTREILSFCSPEQRPTLRALASGALLYFINPVDFIPDYTAGIGFVDDYAVLSLVAEYLVRTRAN